MLWHKKYLEIEKNRQIQQRHDIQHIDTQHTNTQIWILSIMALYIVLY